jgi:general bacterial porin, GBP family
MKKNLIALAIFGAFSGAALAQSNVTLYGIIDVNYQYNDPDGSNSATPGSCVPIGGCSSTSGIQSGHQSGSRFGIRGSEALSSNLNAVFTLEGGVDVSTGQSLQGGRLFGRQAWGGLSGGWGTLVLGRVATFSSGTGSFDMFGNIDPFVTGFGDSSLGSTFTSAGALRLDNSALYQSPTFGGFKFGAGYSFNANGAELAGTGNNIQTWFFGASWAGGPFYAAVTYDLISPPNPGIQGNATTPAVFPNDSEQKNLQIGATWDLKFIKLHAAYAKEDDAFFNVGVGVTPVAGEDADAWMAGVSIPLFGGTLLASYQKREGDPVGVCLGTFSTLTNACTVALTPRQEKIEVWAVGYTYPLSRRTNLYINASDKDGKDFYQGSATLDRAQYTVGIRHLF